MRTNKANKAKLLWAFTTWVLFVNLDVNILNEQFYEERDKNTSKTTSKHNNLVK